MEQAQKLSELIDEFKEKISDKQYKDTLEAVGELMNVKKKEIFVKVIRISCQTTIYTETIKNDDDGQCETELYSSINNFRYEVCHHDCECGECMREPLKVVEIKSGLKRDTIWMKVMEDNEYFSSGVCIGRRSFELLKQDKTLPMGNGDIFVYLEDNE